MFVNAHIYIYINMCTHIYASTATHTQTHPYANMYKRIITLDIYICMYMI